MSVIWVDARAKRNQPQKSEETPSEAKKTTRRTRAKKDADDGTVSRTEELV